VGKKWNDRDAAVETASSRRHGRSAALCPHGGLGEATMQRFAQRARATIVIVDSSVAQSSHSVPAAAAAVECIWWRCW
jgi:NAD(P)-dependent dehydrogenase (short-subunit alcohol dehydrogenase family)